MGPVELLVQDALGQGQEMGWEGESHWASSHDVSSLPTSPHFSVVETKA